MGSFRPLVLFDFFGTANGGLGIITIAGSKEHRATTTDEKRVPSPYELQSLFHLERGEFLSRCESKSIYSFGSLLFVHKKKSGSLD